MVGPFFLGLCLARPSCGWGGPFLLFLVVEARQSFQGVGGWPFLELGLGIGGWPFLLWV